MPLPEQLADVSRELARRGRENSDAPSYTAGVRDTLSLVGELLRLSASGLPSQPSELGGPDGAPDRLRRLAHEIDRLVSADAETDDPSAAVLGPRVRFDLSRARELLAGAATEIEDALGLGRAAREVSPAERPAEETTGGRSTWLAAFALAVARQPGSDDRDVRDIIRLAGDDRAVLAVAARRVEAATGVSPEHRRRARLLFARADALARSGRSAAT